MEISKTDAQAIVNHLTCAAQYFETEARQACMLGLNSSKMKNKARLMRKLTKKLQNILNKQ